MKRLLLTLLLCLMLCAPSWACDDDACRDEMGQLARMSPAILGASSGAASLCPVGTYMSYWTGDYPSDTDKLCVNSGASTKDGTHFGDGAFGTDYGEGGADIGWKHVNANDYVSWAIDTNDIITFTDPITICIRFKWITDGSQVDTSLFEAYYDANNYIAGFLDNTSPPKIQFAWKGNTTTDTVAAQEFAYDTWTTIAYSVKPGEATAAADHAIKLNAGAWVEENDAPVLMASIPTTVKIGDLDMDGQTEEIHYTGFAVISGWEASCPW